MVTGQVVNKVVSEARVHVEVGNVHVERWANTSLVVGESQQWSEFKTF